MTTPLPPLTSSTRADRGVVVWLVAVMLTIMVMVAVGGATRLTGSGLSMVQWHPLMGAIPPLSEAHWLTTFSHYQQSPQYLQVNHWMQLDDFKRIFMWEYAHRLLGRAIGLVFFLPLVFFAYRRRLTGKALRRALVALALGTSQGLLGWFMVKSGLVDRPEVSHFRLAAHLSLAFVVELWLLWMVLDLVGKPRTTRPLPGAAALAFGLSGLVGLQIIYGAFMAGTRAGALFNTFPDMNGSLFPEAAYAAGLWPAVVENPVFIHAVHRTLAWAVLASALAFVLWVAQKTADPIDRRWLAAVLVLTGAQLTLGALTVIGSVPVGTAVLHQVCALWLLGACVGAAHRFSRRRAAPGATSASAAQPSPARSLSISINIV